MVKETRISTTLPICRTVIDTLKTVNDERKCFRLIGGVLCEQTVKVVLPQLLQNKEQLEKLLENGKKQIEQKGQEINEFKLKHDIKIRGDAATAGGATEAAAGEANTGKSNVLVVNN
jgi:prefoldin subunit 2